MCIVSYMYVEKYFFPAKGMQSITTCTHGPQCGTKAQRSENGYGACQIAGSNSEKKTDKHAADCSKAVCWGVK